MKRPIYGRSERQGQRQNKTKDRESETGKLSEKRHTEEKNKQ